jgi:hypothetical protein
MGFTIQFESHKNELAFIHEYEHDNDVLEFYDQPSTIKLDYEAANGRHLGVLHTPDFFVIRLNAVGWEECKTEEELIKLSSKNSNRYVQEADGIWRCPPGEAYSEKLGFYYRVRSSKEINWTYQRNIEFLDDYFRNDSPIVEAAIRDSVLTYVAKKPGISLKELITHAETVTDQDAIFTLIASGELYISLYEVPLVEPDKVRVFPDHDTAIALANIIHVSIQDRFNTLRNVCPSVGNLLQWDGKGWEILNVGETTIGLVGEDETFAEVPIAAFERLIREHRISIVEGGGQSSSHPEVKRRFEQADKRAYAKANRRVEIIRAYICGNPLPANENIPVRTLRYWAAQYRLAEEAYGNGYIGLLPRQRKGNIKPKLPLPTRTLIEEFIQNDYETHKQKGKFAVYSAYRLSCEQRGILSASYKTFCKAVKSRSRYEQTLKRQGRRAAYKDKEFHWQLTPTTPRHGERPLHIAHIDHTELDVELVDSLTGQVYGRPWATFLTDAYSRRMAVYLTYDPPSYRSCMMILRECVRRFGRLPQTVVVDGGLDLSCTYFETLLARYQCTKKTRPPAEGRFGSIVERTFGTTNTRFVHNLQGNTQIMRNVRQVTKSVNPRESALWTLGKAYLYLREWAYEVYDTIDHPALGQCPRNAYASGMLNTGGRLHRLIPYDHEFLIATLPTTRKTFAKVQPRSGVKINNIYYWTDAFRHPEVEGTQVDVRFDPFDTGLGLAYVRGQWTECHSEYYTIFRNHTERELMLAADELRRRYKHHSRQFNVTAKKLAQFLESVESEEVLLRQRIADREGHTILSLINSGSVPPESATPNHPPSTIHSGSQSQHTSVPEENHEVLKPKLYEEF